MPTDASFVKAFDEFLPESPNKAITPDQILSFVEESSGRLSVEEKYDGSLYMARFTSSYNKGVESPFCDVSFKSRRISSVTGVAVDKTENLPWFGRGPNYLDGTLLIGEIVGQSRRFKESAKIMGSGKEKSLAWQQENGAPFYFVFDCPFFRGEDLRGEPQRIRRKNASIVLYDWIAYLRKHSKEVPAPPLHGWEHLLTLSPQRTTLNAEDTLAWYHEIVSRGGEGLIFKDMDSPYGRGVTKCKKVLDITVFCTGFEMANKGKTGKFEGQIGAIKFGVYHNGKVIEIGQASGMDDATRLHMTKNAEKLRTGKMVFDIATQPPDDPEKWNPEKDRMRHPRFIRFRNDVDPKQCTSNKVRADFLRNK